MAQEPPSPPRTAEDDIHDHDSVMGYWDADVLIKLGLSRETVAGLLTAAGRSSEFDEGWRERLDEDDKDPSKPYVARPYRPPL